MPFRKIRTEDVKIAKAAVRKLGVYAGLGFIPGAPGYFISTRGAVFSVWQCRVSGRWLAQQMKTTRDDAGYRQLQIRRFGRFYPYRVHVLIADAFLAPPKPGQTCVRHLDDDRANNSLKNICRGTDLDNKRDAARNGKRVRGIRQHMAILCDADVREMRAMRARGDRYRTIAEKFAVGFQTAYAAVTRRTWQHVV